MKCRNCSYEDEHDGIYCTDCGHNFIEITYPKVCYCIRQEARIGVEIRNQLNASLTLQKLCIGQVNIEINEPIGTGITTKTSTVQLNAREIAEVEPELVFEKKDKVYTVKLTDQSYFLSPIPAVEIAPLEAQEEFMFSPTTGFHKRIKIKLMNNAILRLEGLLLTKAEDDWLRGSESGQFWTCQIPILESGLELTPGNPEVVVTADFSELASEDHSDKEYLLSPKNAYGSEFEIFQESECVRTKLKYRELVPLTIGILHATDRGFAYVVDNSVFRENPTAEKNGTKLIGVHQDYIDLVNWREKVPDDAGVEERITQLNRGELLLRVPAGIKRRRSFTLYQNFLSDQSDKYDLVNNHSYIKIWDNNNHSLPETIIGYREIRMKGWASPAVNLGQELPLSDIRKLNAFEILFDFPEDLDSRELRFTLSIIRKDNSSGIFVDDIKYQLIIQIYKPTSLNDFIAIDFGTSNTCVVGPKIFNGEIIENNSSWYPLNYYHEISEQISTFPTLVAYTSTESDEYSEPFIPDSLFQIGKIFDNFKTSLPDELAGEETYASEVSALNLTLDFLEATTSNLEIYFEERAFSQTIIGNIALTTPTGFTAEIREVITKGLKSRLEQRYNPEDGLDIQMNLDEPLAALNYAAYTDQIPIGSEVRELNLYGVYDFGGGTTDTSFILVDEKEKATLVGTGGSMKVGGNTVDRYLLKRLMMGVDLSDTRQAKEIEISDANDKLRDAGIEKLMMDPQSSLDASKIKHHFKVSLKENHDLPEELCDDLPIPPHSIFGQDADEFEEMKDQIRTIVEKISDKDESTVEFWQRNSNVVIHLLLPFYIGLHRKINEVVLDSLEESCKDGSILPSVGKEKKVNILLLLAGNASRIESMGILVSNVLEMARENYPFIQQIQVSPIDKPKESVALGAYHLTKGTGFYVKKLNNPPMTIFIQNLSPFSVPTQRGKMRGTFLFEQGEKNRESSLGDVLVKVFSLNQLGLSANKAQIQIPIAKKIGIDIITKMEKIKGHGKGNRLAFILTKSNKVDIFRFSKYAELQELKDFQKSIEGGNKEYIQSQFGS